MSFLSKLTRISAAFLVVGVLTAGLAAGVSPKATRLPAGRQLNIEPQARGTHAFHTLSDGSELSARWQGGKLLEILAADPTGKPITIYPATFRLRHSRRATARRLEVQEPGKRTMSKTFLEIDALPENPQGVLIDLRACRVKSILHTDGYLLLTPKRSGSDATLALTTLILVSCGRG